MLLVGSIFNTLCKTAHADERFRLLAVDLGQTSNLSFAEAAEDGVLGLEEDLKRLIRIDFRRWDQIG